MKGVEGRWRAERSELGDVRGLRIRLIGEAWAGAGVRMRLARFQVPVTVKLDQEGMTRWMRVRLRG